MAEPRTFFQKVWDDHVIADLGDNTYLLQIDRLFMHELSGSTSMNALRKSGRQPDSPKQVFTVIDHVVSTRPERGKSEAHFPAGAQMIDTTRAEATAYDFTFFDIGDPRQGIVHVISPELAIALPGTSLVCGDSHTCTVGGIGALAWGIGTTEGEHVLATQTLTQVKPKSMRITFEGALPPHVSAKDMILHLIGTIGVNGGIGHAVEFAGEIIRNLPMESRLTICNMAVEFSAKYGFVAPDDVTFEYLEGREFAPRGENWDAAVAYWRGLPTDEGARFDKEVTIDCADIAPQVTWGTTPGQVASVSGVVPNPATFDDPDERAAVEKALGYMQIEPDTKLNGLALDAAYIGSCANARLSDLREAARILKGRRIPDGMVAICVPGSTRVRREAEAEGIDEIFRAAGFEWHESGCGMCGHMGNDRFADARVISTTNRNFEGRQGPRTRTHLASPATVAASALAGHIADIRKI